MSYTINETEYPSVTAILGQLDKPALIHWALNCFEEKAIEMIEDDNCDLSIVTQYKDLLAEAKKNFRNVGDKAKDIGTQVHDAIEHYVKYNKDLIGELAPEVENGFLAFLEWEKNTVSEWLESEIRTYNPVVGYAGTYDAIFKDKDGNVVMVDFKTSKAVYDEYWFQLAAYRECRHVAYGEYEVFFKRGQTATYKYDLPKIHIDDVAVLRLDKETGLPEYKIRKRERVAKDYWSFFSLVDHYYHAKKRRLKNNPIVANIWE